MRVRFELVGLIMVNNISGWYTYKTGLLFYIKWLDLVQILHWNGKMWTTEKEIIPKDASANFQRRDRTDRKQKQKQNWITDVQYRAFCYTQVQELHMFLITGKKYDFFYSFTTSKDCTESRIIILFRLSFSAIGQFYSMSVHSSESCHPSMDAGKISEDLQAISGFRNYFQDHWLLPVRIKTFKSLNYTILFVTQSL